MHKKYLLLQQIKEMDLYQNKETSWNGGIRLGCGKYITHLSINHVLKFETILL